MAYSLTKRELREVETEEMGREEKKKSDNKEECRDELIRVRGERRQIQEHNELLARQLYDAESEKEETERETHERERIIMVKVDKLMAIKREEIRYMRYEKGEIGMQKQKDVPHYEAKENMIEHRETDMFKGERDKSRRQQFVSERGRNEEPEETEGGLLSYANISHAVERRHDIGKTKCDSEYDHEREIAETQNKLKLFRVREKETKYRIREKQKLHMEEEERLKMELLDENRKRKLDKQSETRRLKDEQRRLMQSVSENESRLRALESSKSDSEQTRNLVDSSRQDKEEATHKERKDGNGSVKTILDRKHIIQCTRPKMQEPKLPPLTEETFEQWKTEVQVMMDSDIYSSDSLLIAVRKSIVNSAKSVRRVLPTIPIKATTSEILDKLDNIYGDRRSGESHLAEYYTSKQMTNENVAEWSIRLEATLYKAEQKGQISTQQMGLMLRKKFWKYLSNKKLKLNTRLLYEKCTSFEELRKEIRLEERELNADSDCSDVGLRRGEQSSVLLKLLDKEDKLEEEINISVSRRHEESETLRGIGDKTREHDYEMDDRNVGNRDRFENTYDGLSQRYQRGRNSYRWQDNRSRSYMRQSDNSRERYQTQNRKGYDRSWNDRSRDHDRRRYHEYDRRWNDNRRYQEYDISWNDRRRDQEYDRSWNDYNMDYTRAE